MIVRVLEVLTESLAIMIGINRLQCQKKILDKYSIIIIALEQILFFFMWNNILPSSGKYIVYILMFIYAKFHIKNKWSKAIKAYTVSIITVFVLQMLAYIVSYLLSINLSEKKYGALVANTIIIIFMITNKKTLLIQISKKINQFKSIIILSIVMFVFIRIITLFNQNQYFEFEIGMQFIIETIGIIVVAIFWIEAEKENKYKAKELQMYETYTNVFEGAIQTIRMRQHEFENHINAIKCMQYTITDKDELIESQNQYCDSILKKNNINKILKSNFEPIIMGFLYSKITNAEALEINVKHKIEEVNIKNNISIYEFIEIVGILFDNSVEALQNSGKKEMLLEIRKKENANFYVEIANESRKYGNNEIEKFCEYGYSSKGNGRGIGLTRIKEICKINNADILIYNKEKNGKNYLCFRIIF